MLGPDQMKRVLSVGGSLSVVSRLSPDTARELVAAAKQGGGKVTFRDPGYSPDVMVNIAIAGPGHVEFFYS